MTGLERWLPAIVGVTVIWLLPAPSLSAQLRADPETFLRAELGFDDGEMERVARGDAVTILIDGDDDAEVATFSAFRLSAEATAVMERLRTVQAQLPGEGQRTVVRLSDPPELSDFDQLELDPDHLEELAQCRPGDCDVKLPSTAIQRFTTELESAEPGAGSAANQIAQDILLGYATAYVRDGNAALAEYHDKSNPQPMLLTFEKLLTASAYLYDEVPEFRRHLLETPRHQLAGTEDYLFWTWQDFGLKPVFSLNHTSVYETDRPSGVRGALATMQIYASHYFLGVLATTLVIQDPGAGDSTYVVRLTRYRFDGRVGGLRRRLLERRLRGYAERAAEALRDRAG